VYRLVKVLILSSILAVAVIGILWMTDVIPPGQFGSVAAKTFGVLGIIFGAAFVWRAVAGRTNIPDRTDQRVP
jgi:hypothetical protein